MKKGIWSLVLLALFAGTISAELKLGYINSDEILAQYHGTKAAEEELRKEYAKWEQEATEKQNRIREMQDQLQKQALLLSEERKAQIGKDLQDSVVVYQQFLQDKFGQEGEAARRNSELLKPIIEKVNVIIDKIAVEENYDFIFDTKGGVVFAKKSYDITERVLKALNVAK